MRSLIYKYLPGFFIFIFSFYWIINISNAISQTTRSDSSRKTFRVLNMVSQNWDFFNKAIYADNRLYFVVRNRDTKKQLTNIEVMENLLSEKKTTAPFNQKENCIEHLLNHNISILYNETIKYRKGLPISPKDISDSGYLVSLNETLKDDKNYTCPLATLENYCKITMAEKKIDTVNEEFKIVIAGKRIKPFNQKDNPDFSPDEIVFFETLYKPFGQ